MVIGIFTLVKKGMENYCTFRKCSYPREKFIHEINDHIIMVGLRSNSFQSPPPEGENNLERQRRGPGNEVALSSRYRLDLEFENNVKKKKQVITILLADRPLKVQKNPYRGRTESIYKGASYRRCVVQV